MNLGQELLHITDAVAREKNINREEVIEAIELSIQKAAKAKYGNKYDIRAMANLSKGEIQLFQYQEVVETVENECKEINITDAKKINSDIKVGEFITKLLPPIDFCRIAAQTAKQVIVQKVREAERKHQYDEYKNRVGEIINGIVKRIEFGSIIVDIGKAEAVLYKENAIPRESFRTGDRIRAYITEVKPETKGAQIFLSRIHPQFLALLFSQEVPEIYDGVIKIKSAVRDPGSRAKIAVISSDTSIDPIGACVGVRGSRVQSIVNELQGEKIDIIPWSEDPATFVVNALIPAEVSKVILDEENKKIEVIVPDEQLSLAIGRRGQNVRLASKLTGWDLNILTETSESERRNKETQSQLKLFIDSLDVDEVIAHLLCTEGFSSIEDIAFAPIEELKKIESFDDDIATELHNRAKDFIKKQETNLNDQIKKLGISSDLSKIKAFSTKMIVTLGENNIKTLDNLAELSNEELLELLKEYDLNEESANKIIMDARAHWFNKK